jgi:hypothetical protein
VHIADCYNHVANVGNWYITNPPGVDARIHAGLRGGRGGDDAPVHRAPSEVARARCATAFR